MLSRALRGVRAAAAPGLGGAASRAYESAAWRASEAAQARAEELTAASALEARAAEFKRPWRLVSATILERRPTLLPDLEDWEADMEALWERQNETARVVDPSYWKKNAGDDEEEAQRGGGGGGGGDMAFDSDEAWIQDLPPGMHRGGIFVPAPRETEADASGDRRTPDRALTEPLFLIVKKDRAEHAWQFPQGGRSKGERMVDAARRELAEECGEALDSYYLSPAPIGHMAYALPEAEQKRRKTFGVKVFFYRAYLLDGGADLDLDLDELADYAWVTREEMAEYMDAETYAYVEQLL